MGPVGLPSRGTRTLAMAQRPRAREVMRDFCRQRLADDRRRGER